MTAGAGSGPDIAGPVSPVQPWRIVGQAAAALAASMGIGRFAYTAILPLMQTQAGLSPRLGAELATANYSGYLAGAIAATAAPVLVRSRPAFRLCLLVLIGTLALMPATHIVALWLGLRLIAGVASALIFVIAVSASLTGLQTRAQHLIGWAFGGVGAGITLSGVVVLTVSAIGANGAWRLAWWSAAALAAACTVPAWRLPIAWHPDRSTVATRRGVHASGSRWFAALLTSYSLEGIGYIIAGTFLVAAIDQTGPGWIGSGAWIIVGAAALPSSVLWARLSDRWSRPALLLVALIVQAVGIALPAFAGGVGAALVSAALFGATFLGVAALALAIGAYLQVPRSVAILTTGYSIGQILGPLAVTPLLHNGYHQALLVGAGVVAFAAATAAALRHSFPQQLAVSLDNDHLPADSRRTADEQDASRPVATLNDRFVRPA